MNNSGIMTPGKRARSLISAGFVFGVGLLAAVPRLPALENEILFGNYVYTLRNLETRGVTASYRLWFSDWEEPPGRAFSLLYPRPLTWGVEAGAGRVYRPESAWEGSLSLLLKLEENFTRDIGAFVLASGGGSYSQAHYEYMSTDLNFSVRAALGIRLQRFILQGAYEHRSNAGIKRPNRGMDVLLVSLGFRF